AEDRQVPAIEPSDDRPLEELGVVRLAVDADPALAVDEPHEPDHHAHAGDAEPQMPVDVLAEITADEGREERADVDPHVEDRESTIAAPVVLAVESSNGARDVGLEEAVPEAEESEGAVERILVPRVRGVASPAESLERGDRHREVAERHERSTEEDRPAIAEPLVR